MEKEIALSDLAARESALLSGARISGERFRSHQEVMKHIFGCTSGALTHPIIIHTTLSGDRNVCWRESIRAGDNFAVRPRHVKWLFALWWRKVELSLSKMAEQPEDIQESYCWEQHDYFLSLAVFDDQNGRTARIIYYMLRRALKLPLEKENLISSAKATSYNAHKRRYREHVFAPLMRKHGYIPD